MSHHEAPGEVRLGGGRTGEVTLHRSRFTDPEGNLVEVRYVADEFGFRAESPYVPTPHPLPAHALQQIAYAEELRRLRAQNGEEPVIF